MNFGFTEEQELLRAEVRKFLDQNCPLEEVRKLCETPEGFSRSLWERMAELGWVGLTISEEGGGVGLGWVDLVVVLEEVGRSLFPSPLLSTVLAAKAVDLNGTEAQKSRWLPGLADGSWIGAVAITGDEGRLDAAGIALEGRPDGDVFTLDGEKLLVMDAQNADILVVAFRTGSGDEDLSLAVVERSAKGLDIEPHRTMDLTRRMGRLHFDGVRVSADALLGSAGSAWAAIEHLQDCAAAAVCAEMVGAAEGALKLTTDFANQRVQFGQLIGRFQGVKHPLAEMFVDIESFKSLCYYAAWLLDERSPEAPLAVSRAKAYASESFARIGVDSVQLHGGVGYTWEYDIQLYLKRAKWARPAFGDAEHHYQRVAKLRGF